MVEVHDFIGYCPKLDADRQISVEYAVVKMARRPSDYKKLGFECPDADDCEYVRDSYCPLHRKAHP